MSIICREYAASLIEFARGGPLETWERDALLVHLDSCADCARQLAQQRAFDRSIRDLASDVLLADSAIEVGVLAEFDRVKAVQPIRKQRSRWFVAAALAAAILLAAFWTLRSKPVVQTSEEEPFLTIPYTIPLAPEERADVVRMRIPVAALMSVGFHVQTSDPSAVVDADVLVSQDGRARAIRALNLVNVS